MSEPVEFRGEATVVVTDAARIADVCAFARRELGFDFLVDMASVDNYGQDPRFTVVYELARYQDSVHLRLKTHVSEEQACLPTVSAVWPAADWQEREIYDMMGVRFQDHPDLRRILMWDGYPYYPLRKDFPLAGKPVDLPGLPAAAPAPLEGGPFVTCPGGADPEAREPRVRIPEETL